MNADLFTFQGDSSANGGASKHLCATNGVLGAGKVGIFFCKPTASGRYVYVRIPGNDKVVTLCEVEVYSSYLHSKYSFDNREDIFGRPRPNVSCLRRLGSIRAQP